MAYTRKARHTRKGGKTAKKHHKKSHKKAGSRRHKKAGSSCHAKGGKRRHHKKKGGSLGLVLSQLAAPGVLFAANHIYGKKSRRHRKKSHKKSLRRRR